MATRLVPCFVIQDRSSGAFLAEDLSWVTMLRGAGRLYDPQEAADTATDNCHPGEYDIFMFYVLEPRT